VKGYEDGRGGGHPEGGEHVAEGGSLWQHGDDVFSYWPREEDDDGVLRWSALEKLQSQFCGCSYCRRSSCGRLGGSGGGVSFARSRPDARKRIDTTGGCGCGSLGAGGDVKNQNLDRQVFCKFTPPLSSSIGCPSKRSRSEFS
jgi:hypothetical protein